MKKELEFHDDELIELGSVTDKTDGGIPGSFDDKPQPRMQLGILVD